MERFVEAREAGGEAQAQSVAVCFIRLCVRQIREAMAEADSDIGKLSSAVVAMEREISRLAPDDGTELRTAVQGASLSLQALDRFQQRITNTCGNMAQLLEFFGTTQPPVSEESWQEFLSAARSTYTMDAERIVFDNMFQCPDSKSADEWQNEQCSGLLIF